MPLRSFFGDPGKYPKWKEIVSEETFSAVLEELFRTRPTLPAVIVEAKNGAAGMLSRRMFLDALSRPFGRALLLNRPLSELIAMVKQDRFALDDRTELATACRLALAREETVRYDPVLLTSSDDPLCIVDLTTLLSAQTDALEQALIEQYQLAEALEEARRCAEHDATHDSLTGLLNRKGFLARMQTLMASGAGQSGRSYGLMFLDLDRFKLINDSLGHQAGNALLVQVAQRLTIAGERCQNIADMGGACCIVGRHSGDEFVILHAVSGDTTSLWAAAQEFYNALSLPYMLDSKPYRIGVSIGMVGSLAPYKNHEAALRDADIAMYEAKHSSTQKIVLFEPTMYVQVEHRLLLETDLRQAISKGELILYFQPIICITTGGIFAYEALIRWQSPHGLLSPGEFIPLAEETGLINDIGFWVLEYACRWLCATQILNRHDDTCISINVSPLQLSDAALPTKFAGICASLGVPPNRIIVEVTEQAVMASPERIAQTLSELKDHGFMIALDDFGTGYSSLMWLHKLPVDLLKIDKSLIADVDSSTSAAKMAAAILQLSDSLSLRTIVEGVERSTQVEKLHRLGFSLLQGYYFGRPQPDPIDERVLGFSCSKVRKGPVRLSGTENRHKATQNAHAEVGFLMG